MSAAPDLSMVEVTDPDEIASIREDCWLHGPDWANQVNGMAHEGRYYAYRYSLDRFRAKRQKENRPCIG